MADFERLKAAFNTFHHELADFCMDAPVCAECMFNGAETGCLVRGMHMAFKKETELRAGRPREEPVFAIEVTDLSSLELVKGGEFIFKDTRYRCVPYTECADCAFYKTSECNCSLCCASDDSAMFKKVS
jgi:hypothetical protein